MKAAVLVDELKIEYRDVPTPEPKEGEVLVRVHYAGICGTDMHVYHGMFKERANLPRILCHEFSGEIAAVGANVAALKVGDRVVADPIISCGRCPACLSGQYNVCSTLKLIGIDIDGAFAEYVVADARKVFKIPDNLSTRTAVLAEPYALGVHSCRRAVIEPGDKVVVLGAGRLGLAVLEVLRQTAAALVVSVDIFENRLDVAKKMGADLALNSKEKDPVKTVLELTEGYGADRVIETVGVAPEIPQQAVSMTRNGGRIVMMGLGTKPAPVMWNEVVLKELSIVGSRVYQGEFPRALSLMAQDRFHPDLLISQEVELERTAEAFKLVEEKPGDYIKFLIKTA